MTDDDQKDGGGDQRGRGGEGVVVKQRGLSAAFGRSAIPLVNQSSLLPVPHGASMLLVSGKIPVLFENKPWGEPLRMEDVQHDLHFVGFTP